ncbi:MAG: chemotaxis protein CheW [Phycisphaerae bacterium]|nr:chemotaxis protein CheW [Phycisphaerae bacterium]
MALNNDNILEEFVVESREHLADVENDLLAIEEAGADLDSEVVNRVFRAVHSIKGAAGFLGLTTIGNLSHALESVLNLIRNGDLTPKSSAIDVLLLAADALRGLINNVHQSNEVDVSEHIEALTRIITGETNAAVQESLAQHLTVNPASASPFELSAHMLETQARFGNSLFIVEFDLVANVEEKGKTPFHLVKELLAIGEILDSRLDHAEWGDLASGAPASIRFITLIGTVADAEMLAVHFEIPTDQIHAVDPGQITAAAPAPPAQTAPVTPEAPSAAPVAAAPPSDTQQDLQDSTLVPAAPEAVDTATPTKLADTNIRVSVGLLDHLMNLAGELVLSRNQLIQAINGKHQDSLESIGGQLDRITSELQESIMQTRMQPIGTVFNRFPRVVRDLSTKLGKQCELITTGTDVELDKSIIEAITDPLTHLVRNSVDHGVETPDERAARGKPPSGTVALRAFHQAGKVNIVIQDDGAGIDARRLKDKAVSKGLITPDQAKEMSARDAIRLIFHPGFSTADRVSDVSGRGVGMDVVKTNIERLGGTVEVETEVGVGTTVHTKLPLTLAIIPSLIVRSGNERFAIPQVNINELVRIKASEVSRKIERIKDAELLRLRGNLLPLVRLSSALSGRSTYFDSISREWKDNHRERIADRRQDNPEVSSDHQYERSAEDRRDDTTAGALNIIVVESGHLRYGLIVDTLHDSEEIVVKPLGRHMKGSSCLAGATILGDGSVAMILDVAGIAIDCALAVPEDAAAEAERSLAAEALRETQSVLLFTNAPTEQFGIPMGLIERIERIREEQIDSVGGQEVLQYRGASLPLLNLEGQIKAKPRVQQPKLYVAVFRISGREVGLVVPQLVDIREIPAAIDNVTFHEPGVLGSIIVDDKTTRLIDLFALAEKARPEWFAERKSVAGPEGNAPWLLLVEDSDFFRTQLSSFLEAEGYHVTACEDGQAAWNVLQDPERHYDLVVTDIEMPTMNGLELTRRIKTDPAFAHLPVIAVTSLASEEDIQSGNKAGIDDYQIKLDRERLLASVRRHLNNARDKAGLSRDAVTANTRSSR